MKQLINAANLHVGGGVQVAASFISELTAMDEHGSVEVVMSSEVARNVAATLGDRYDRNRYRILDVHGLDLGNRAAREVLDASDTVFTVFGPLYRWKPRFRNIVGFAQPWIIYPENECYERLPAAERFREWLKYKVQAGFFERADVLVVELEHVKAGLVQALNVPAERIQVVHNSLSSIYTEPQVWRSVTLPPADCDLRLGFLGRNYMHKNTRIFPDIVRHLSGAHGIDARFFVTFTDAEWAACTPNFREVCINVGPLSVAQCPDFYRSVDAVVFPSLLECFSATPLEAMAMGKPLFASDRPFNRDVCKEHAVYFDPLIPELAAERIAEMFEGDGFDEKALRAAQNHAFAFASPSERAKQYLALLNAG
ncbi:glycosyltransferase family 4 protein [Qipengyuania sp. 483]